MFPTCLLLNLRSSLVFHRGSHSLLRFCFLQRDISVLGCGDRPGERVGSHQVRRLYARGPGSEAPHRPGYGACSAKRGERESGGNPGAGSRGTTLIPVCVGNKGSVC